MKTESKKFNYRAYYELCTGEKIPYGYDVHHLDRDRKNNHISNLVAIPKDVHKRVHKHINRFDKVINMLNIQRAFFKCDYKKLYHINEYMDICNVLFEYVSDRDQLLYNNNYTDEIYDGSGVQNIKL